MLIFGNWKSLKFHNEMLSKKFRASIGNPVDLDLPNHLKTINTYVNNLVDYFDDKDDDWQTPQQTLESRRGDCEDIVLLKRAILRAKGWRDDQLIMLVARDVVLNIDHSVLLVVDNGRVFMLDNFTNKIIDATKRLTYLVPVYGMTETDGFTFGTINPTEWPSHQQALGK